MNAVFVGGSRKLSRLNDPIKRRLASIIKRGLWVYVGDANGADKALQQFFASRGYDRVVVYCVGGRYRNNVGRWQTRPVHPPAGARGFEYYAAKDIQMATDASFGMMLWDGRSRGTLANIRNLVASGKPVAVYLSPERRFKDLKRETDLMDLLTRSVPSGTSAANISRTAQQQLALFRKRRRGSAA